jgi:hypothetical protein
MAPAIRSAFTTIIERREELERAVRGYSHQPTKNTDLRADRRLEYLNK